MRLKKAGILTKIVIFALLIYAAVTLLSLQEQISSAKKQEDLLEGQVKAQVIKNADLSDDIEHSDDTEVIKEIARDKLGLVSPGERVFYSTGG